MNHYFNRTFVALAVLLGVAAMPVRAAEQDAIAISSTIQQRHIPNGTIIDPIFASPSSQTVVGYTRGGDSALWTGNYLAAEAFRYKVTGSADALANVWVALRGIHSLRAVTGTNLMARCVFPPGWAFASSVSQEEAGHGIFSGTVDGQNLKWVGGTSRDQYAGVFFGLGVAYDMVDDSAVRAYIKTEVSALLGFLTDNGWAVTMPDHSISTVFWTRPDQELSLLQIGRRINPDKFSATYTDYRSRYATLLVSPIGFDCLDDYSSYFKFNIDEETLYNLIRLEDTPKGRKRFMKAYKILRATVDNHLNAHFNMIDRALKDPDPVRDAETRGLLDDWLKRPRRDVWVDSRSKYQLCGNSRACHPIGVADRITTDFLWQRNPFDTLGGGAGTIEGAGIDYILPYWMARYYGIVAN